MVREVTRQDVERFHRDGFVVFEEFIDTARVREARARFDALFAGEFETGVLPDKVKWLAGRDAPGVPQSQCNVWKADRAIARVSLAEEVGRVAAQLMGWPGARANQDSILFVPAGAGTTGHHQDDSYQAWHLPGDVVTCWIALEDTSADGGTLEYVRGSHTWPLGPRIEQFTAPADYRKELNDEAARLGVDVEIVPVVVRAGGASFHHGRMWHGANYNRTPQGRSTVSVHCMSSESTFHPTVPSPMFNHYKHFDDVRMDESFFPILWTKDGRRSRFLEGYLGTDSADARPLRRGARDEGVRAEG